MKVLVFGTFDRLHPGHVFLLTEAAKRGELHVVVARDANVLRMKGKFPEQGEVQRKHALEEAFPDAHVVLGDPEDFLRPVFLIQPDLILLGYDQKLPPGVRVKDLPCPLERLPAFQPEKYKSSLRRSQNNN
jgi:FAD synthetase